MQAPTKPVDEDARLSTLSHLKILDTPPEERFDRITRLAKRLFDVPIALVSLIDEERQWFKSSQGLDAPETARDISFCGHAILGDELFLIPDTTRDERFHDNPLVAQAPNIRFYAGMPLTVPDGSRLGTLCIIDREPRDLNDDDVALMHDLAHMVEQELATVALATMDELTTISNRRGFEALGKHALGLCARQNKPASLAFFDLDSFKQINDNFGHAEGDRALTEFAQLLQKTFRDDDVIGRLGGDEFVVLLTNTRSDEVQHVLSRLEQAVEQHNRAAQRAYEISYSVGSAIFDGSQDDDIARMMAAADQSMYEQKSGKHLEKIAGALKRKNRVRIVSPPA